MEFAVVAPLLLLLFMGIVEFGLLMMHQLTLIQAAREGARQASLGTPVAEVDARVRAAAEALTEQAALTVDLSYSTDNGQTYANALGDDDDGDQNNAPADSLVRVSARWPHQLITGGFFSWLRGVEGDELPIEAHVVMRRE